MANDETPQDVHPLVGVPDGHVDDAGETIVYEYDDEGNLIGWHKEVKDSG